MRITQRAAVAFIALAAAGPNRSRTVSSVDYLGTYSGSSRVSVWRGEAADLVVHGQLLDTSTGIELINVATGAVATGASVAVTDRVGGGDTRIKIHLTSTSSAALGDYEIRIHYFVEANGPDRVPLRMFDKQSVSAIRIDEPSTFGRYIVGQSYTLVATGTGLSHATFGPPIGVTFLSTLGRTSSESRFSVRFDTPGLVSIGKWDFYDDAMRPARPSEVQRHTAGYGPSSGGSNFPSFIAATQAVVTSVSATSPAVGSTVTLSGEHLTPRGYDVAIDFPGRYFVVNAGTNKISAPATASNGRLSFSVPANIRGDSGSIRYTPTGSVPADSSLLGAPVPILHIVGPPVLTQMFSVSLTKILFQGSRTLIGNYLFGDPTCSSKSCALGGSALTPSSSVVFGSTPITVTRAVYSPNAQTVALGTNLIQQGADSLVVDVPAITPSGSSVPDTTTGTITITTSAGSTSIPNVYYAPRPQVTAVRICCSATQPAAGSTLIRNVTYQLLGRAFRIGPHETNLSTASLTLNGAPIASTLIASESGGSVQFTVPTTATSGPLVVSTQAGSTTVGNFAVASPSTGVSIVGMTLSPNPIVGGHSVTATVALNAVIPPGGSAGNLQFRVQPSTDATVSLPVGLVPVTSNPLVIQFQTSVVTAAHSTTIVVNNEATSQVHTSALSPLTLQPPAPTSIALTSQTVTGGQTAGGAVNLNVFVPATPTVPISLASSDPSTVTVPASVNAAGTRAEFPITTSVVPVARTVTITATSGGQSQSVNINVTPAVPSSLTLAQSTIVAELPDTATITLTGAPPTPATATIQCTDAALVCPASVTISGTTAKFAVKSVAIPSARTVTVGVTVNGQSKTATLSLVPLGIQSLTVSPTSVRAGTGSSVTLQLNGAVPSSSGTISVALSSSNANVVTLPGPQSFTLGTVTKLVPIGTLSPQSQNNTVTLAATFTRQTNFGPYTSTATGTLTVTP